MRIIRALIALLLIGEAIRTQEYILLLPAGVLALQAAFNVGCAGGSCALPEQPKKHKQT